MSEDSQHFLKQNKSMPKKLLELHGVLLRLHKLLLDSEKIVYESKHGSVGSPGQFLNLVMNDPFFQWLRPISQMIVVIDEIMESDIETSDQVNDIKLTKFLQRSRDLVETVRQLFNAGAQDTEFMKKYKAVLKIEPGVVNAHFELQKVLISLN